MISSSNLLSPAATLMVRYGCRITRTMDNLPATNTMAVTAPTYVLEESRSSQNVSMR